MPSIQKFAILALAMIAIGALQFAVPAFSSKNAVTSSLSIEKQADVIDLVNLSVDNLQGAQQGTLYFVTDDQTTSTQKETISPLVKTNVDINVTGIVARTKLTQTFKNASDDWVNGLYVFPLPENAAVDHLLMTVGERKIEGQIKEKSQAKKVFEQAKAEGKKASLITQQRPNVFSNSIANIGPGESIEISIEYQQVLAYSDQQYSLRFPMTITPRYSPKDSPNTSLDVEPVYQTNPIIRNNNQVKLTVNLKTGFELEKINSEFHAISSKQLSDGSQHIELSGDTIANKDFILTWQPELGAQPQTSYFKQNVNGDEYGLIMLLPPKPTNTQNKQLTPREVIFVLDTSGSMEGESITQAKQALILAIEQLSENDSFNIIEFNSYAQNLWMSAKVADQTNKYQAKEFVSGLSANGGTNIRNAFNLAFPSSIGEATESNSASNKELEETAKLRQIIFVTDGSISNEEPLMQQIKQNIGDSRLFTVGIGSAPNTYFMTEAAKMGRGTFTYIGSTEQVQEKMQTLLNKLQHPALTNIELQLNSAPLINNQYFEIYPNIISDLYLGEPLVLSYRLDGSNSEHMFSTNNTQKLSLVGEYQSSPWTGAVQLKGSNRQSGINVLWAREKIAQLTRDKRSAAMKSNTSQATQDEYQSMITQTALDHHLVSQYTSLVAIDVTPTKPQQRDAKNKRIANRIPAGASHKQRLLVGKLPQTATNAELNLLIGLILIGLSLCIRLVTKRKVFSLQH
jgi:Ca-activated chloride channel family protein